MSATEESQVTPSNQSSPTIDDSVEDVNTDSASSSKKDVEKSRRLYITNVPFDTTEDELLEFFQDFKVTSIIVPSHTVKGFKGKRYQRPLGIAYAEFQDHGDAAAAIELLNGKELDGRELRIKYYVPYAPTNKLQKNSGSKNNKSDEEVGNDVEDAKLANQNQNGGNDVKTKELSKDTIYVSRIHPKVTDADLRVFFAEYDPVDIFMFKGKFSHRAFHFSHRRGSALVVLADEATQQKALSELKDKKLNNRYIQLTPAYFDKVEEIKKKNLESKEKETAKSKEEEEKQEEGDDDEEGREEEQEIEEEQIEDVTNDESEA